MGTQISGWDRGAFVHGLRDALAPLEHLLQPGDAFDYDRFRFFAAQGLNGGNEVLAIVPLTPESPSELARYDIGNTIFWAQAAPLPLAAFLPLDNTDCFSVFANGMPYLMRCLDWDRTEFVDATGAHVRDASRTFWERGSQKPEWLQFTGGAPETPEGSPHGVNYHAPSCCTTTTNQSG